LFTFFIGIKNFDVTSRVIIVLLVKEFIIETIQK